MSINLNASAIEQISWLAAGQVTSEQLLDAYLERNKKLQSRLNAVVAYDEASARRAARTFDAKRAKGEEIGPLQGLPMTIKDSLDVEGMPAVCGVPALKHRDPRVSDAAVVVRLKTAGAVIWGKTNAPQFAGDIQTYNKVYGTTNNPYDVSKTPGGSSGGSAAALAAGITPLEVGSDIGGSLRIPSHNCGLCTIKPTYGYVSTQGHVPPTPERAGGPPVDLGVVGPMARNMGDLELLFSVISPGTDEQADLTLKDLRVAVWNVPEFALSDEVTGVVDQVEQVVRNAGGEVHTDKPEVSPDQLMDVYQKLLMPIVTSEMPRVVHAVFRMMKPFAQMFAKKGRVSFSNTILSATQSTNQLLQARAEREKMKQICNDFFDSYDVMLAPVISVPAIPHNLKGTLYSRKVEVDDQVLPYATLFEWISLASCCHLPAAVIPVAMSSTGVPMGIQLVGREGSDWKIIKIARLLEQAIGFTPQPDILTDRSE